MEEKRLFIHDKISFKDEQKKIPKAIMEKPTTRANLGEIERDDKSILKIKVRYTKHTQRQGMHKKR